MRSPGTAATAAANAAKKKQKSPVRAAGPTMTTYARAPKNKASVAAPKLPKNRAPKLIPKNKRVSTVNTAKNTANSRNARRHRPGKGETKKFRELFEKLGIESALVAKKQPPVIRAPSPNRTVNARAAAIALLRARRQTSS